MVLQTGIVILHVDYKYTPCGLEGSSRIWGIVNGTPRPAIAVLAECRSPTSSTYLAECGFCEAFVCNGRQEAGKFEICVASSVVLLRAEEPCASGSSSYASTC